MVVVLNRVAKTSRRQGLVFNELLELNDKNCCGVEGQL